jgi:hypothetical protein
VGILLLLGARRRQRNSCEAAVSCPLDPVAMRTARSRLRLCVWPNPGEHAEFALHLQIPTSDFLEKQGWPRELRQRVWDQSKLATGQTGVVSSARDRLAGLIACGFIGTDRHVWYESSSIGSPSGQYNTEKTCDLLNVSGHDADSGPDVADVGLNRTIKSVFQVD